MSFVLFFVVEVSFVLFVEEQSITGILDPGNSRENQLDFFSLDHEK